MVLSRLCVGIRNMKDKTKKQKQQRWNSLTLEQQKICVRYATQLVKDKAKKMLILS